MTKDIEDLEHAFTIDDEFAVVEESKVAIVVLVVFIHPEHQLEAALVICSLGLEAVARVGEEVGLDAGQVVN